MRSFYLTAAFNSGKFIPYFRLFQRKRLRYRLNAGGGMDFVHGPLIIAMKEGGWFLIDEIDLLDPSTAAGLNGVAEGRSITIPETGEVVTQDAN